MKRFESIGAKEDMPCVVQCSQRCSIAFLTVDESLLSLLHSLFLSLRCSIIFLTFDESLLSLLHSLFLSLLIFLRTLLVHHLLLYRR